MNSSTEHTNQVARGNIDIPVRLLCSGCQANIVCDKSYFGTSFFIAPHASDSKYTFHCKTCQDEPRLVHKEKNWTEIVLAALTTLEMMNGWAWVSMDDIEAFVDSNFAEIAINKERGANTQWKTDISEAILACPLIHSLTKGDKLFYSLHRNGNSPENETQFIPEKILHIRKNPDGSCEYKVKWLGFHTKYATWESFTNLNNSALFSRPKEQEAILTNDEVYESSEADIAKSKANASERTSTKRPARTRRAPHSFYDEDNNTGTTPTKRKQPDTKPESSSSSSSEESSEEEKTKEQMIEELMRETPVPTPHSTFEAACSTCKVNVPVIELGDTIISPSCSNWTMNCATCAGGKSSVLYADKITFSEIVQRALFYLQAHNPLQAYWSADDVVNTMLTNPSYKSAVEGLSASKLRLKIAKSIMSYSRVTPLFVGSGRYQYQYKVNGTSDTPDQTSKTKQPNRIKLAPSSAKKRRSTSDLKSDTPTVHQSSDAPLMDTPPSRSLLSKHASAPQLSPAILESPFVPQSYQFHDQSHSFTQQHDALYKTTTLSQPLVTQPLSPSPLNLSPVSPNAQAPIRQSTPQQRAQSQQILGEQNQPSPNHVTQSNVAAQAHSAQQVQVQQSDVPQLTIQPALEPPLPPQFPLPQQPLAQTPSQPQSSSAVQLSPVDPPSQALTLITQQELPVQMTQLQLNQLPDVFVHWYDENERITFLRISLDSLLTDIRQKLRILLENDKFTFIYKKAPVHSTQESFIFVRECVIQCDDGFSLTIKHI